MAEPTYRRKPPLEPSSRRERLSVVLRQSADVVTVDDASAALKVDRTVAAKTLARWAQQGWLKRVRRGLYAPVPLEASPADQVIEDAWALVPRLFAPAYIGGASAASHWDLTEQMFRTVFVFTARPVRRSKQVVQRTSFLVRHVAERRIFGTRALWRGRVKIEVSDVHRTVVDMLDAPSCGGGISQVFDCLRVYLTRQDADTALLLSYADRLGNGAVFKRLGFLAERAGLASDLVEECARRLTKGVVKLDPAITAPRLVRRWRLWIPDRWKTETAR